MNGPPGVDQAWQGLVASVGPLGQHKNMKRVIDTSEALGVVETPEGAREVCAAADASYDEGRAKLIVKLDAYLRNTDLLSKEKRFSADWLPKPETIYESVSLDETVELARDIFHRWVRKVRQAVPALANR